MLDAVADSIFKLVDQPLLPSQKNFVPVEEIGDTVEVTCTRGNIPSDFPQGVYVRNGRNPLFGVKKSTISIFGPSSHTWVEGEGMLRFGEINKQLRKTNIFEHSEKIYVAAENHRPQEIDIRTLESFHEWDVDGAWDRNFTAHPKKAPNSGELVIMGVDATKPYYVLGVFS
ncbi:Carotenoid oxygenase, partial [Parasponia andersonii]